jgi:hypothetical protein
MAKKWFKARNLGNRVIGVSARGFDRNIGQDDEVKKEIYLTAMTGTSPRKEAYKLVDLLNNAVNEYYGRKPKQ